MSTDPSPELVGALRGLAGVPRLLVALDFDGTLAPHVDDPGQARAVPEARAAVLRLLALPETPVAFVSGRALDSLATVSEAPEDALLVGSHGIEFRLGDPGQRLGLTADEVQRVERLHEVLNAVAGPIDGVWLEEKPAGYALHTRLADGADARRAQLEALAETEAALDDLTVRRGKDVLEFSVRSATKGDAVEQLRRHTDADAVLYAGDDVTDEDAFAVLRPSDVGLKSGPGRTAADFRVGGPDDVAAALALLARFREEARPAP